MREEKHWEAYVFYVCDILEQECGEPTQRYGSHKHPSCDGCPITKEDPSQGDD